jgi:hypothetical protein
MCFIGHKKLGKRMVLEHNYIQMGQSTRGCSAMGSFTAVERSLKQTVMYTLDNGLGTRQMEGGLSSIARKVYATLVNGSMTLNTEWVRKHGTTVDALSM